MPNFYYSNISEEYGLEDNYYKNIYIKCERNKSGEEYFSIVHFTDGIEDKSSPELYIKYNNHCVLAKDVKNFIDILESDFIRVCERADQGNKTIIGFEGIIKTERTWLVKCNTCGETKVSYMRFFHQCKNCAIIAQRKTFKQFLIEAIEKHGDKYVYNDNNYKDTTSKISILCTKCNLSFIQSVKEHLKGYGCTYCKESRGEIAVRSYLNKCDIEFDTKKTYDGLTYKSQLNYDFYLTELNMLIEFDGKQHFEIIPRSKDPNRNIKDFEATQKRDKIKDKYAHENGIPLLRIPYWDIHRVPEVIDNFLKLNIVSEIKQLAFEF